MYLVCDWIVICRYPMVSIILVSCDDIVQIYCSSALVSYVTLYNRPLCIRRFIVSRDIFSEPLKSSFKCESCVPDENENCRSNETRDQAKVQTDTSLVKVFTGH